VSPRRHPSTSAIFAYAARLRIACLREYRVLQEAEYAAAEQATNGVMLNTRGWQRGVDPRDVIYGPPVMLDAYGSEELQEYLRHHPRTTRAAFEREWLDQYLGGGDQWT